MYKLIMAAVVVLLAACGKETPVSEGARPVAAPIPAAQTYFDGTDTAPWLALNKACKEESAAGKRGVNCLALDAAAQKVNEMLRANPSGFVGVRIK